MKKIVLLTLLFVMLAAVPALAGPPVTSSEWISTNDPVYDCSVFDPAWDFTVWWNEEFQSTGTTFFDKTGAAVKYTEHNNGVDYLYREGQRENTVSGHFNITWHIDLLTGATKASGNLQNIHLPGTGNVLHISGQAYWDETGLVRDVGVRVQDVEPLCAYFAD